MENLEPRVLALEALILSMNLDALRARLAALENQSWQTTLGNSGGGVAGAYVVKLTGAVSPRSGTTVHSCTADLYNQVSGTLTATGDSIPALWNITNKTGASGAYGVAVQVFGGDYWLVAIDDCAHLT